MLNTPLLRHHRHDHLFLFTVFWLVEGRVGAARREAGGPRGGEGGAVEGHSGAAAVGASGRYRLHGDRPRPADLRFRHASGESIELYVHTWYHTRWTAVRTWQLIGNLLIILIYATDGTEERGSFCFFFWYPTALKKTGSWWCFGTYATAHQKIGQNSVRRQHLKSKSGMVRDTIFIRDDA